MRKLLIGKHRIMNHLGRNFQHVKGQISILHRNLNHCFYENKTMKIFSSDRIRLEIDDRMFMPSLRPDSHQPVNDLVSRNHQSPYSIITGSKNPDDLVDCQIILVNARQRFFLLKLKNKIYFYCS